jgi:recombination associated protein RdgC
MFKNAIIYRASKLPTSASLDTFVPCGSTQEKSSGWVPPRGEEHGALIEVVAGQTILKLMTETKSVPGDVIARKAQERIRHIQQTTGRKPGKKETREIKDELKLALLPHAFAKRSATLVWFTPDGFLVIDTASQAKATDVVMMLVRAIDGLMVTLVNTNKSPALSMAHWLIEQEPPKGFSIDRECELKAADETKAVVKYGRHPLDIDEVRTHVLQGKIPTKLALTFDSRVSFVLSDALVLKKITFLDSVFEEQSNENQADAFDGDVTILAGEMRPLLKNLLDALGGEIKVEVGAA